MKKYLVEFIGTFFLVLTIGSTVIVPGAGNLAPLAIGAALMIMVYAGGHVSGGHYNPAVTLGVFLRGKCPATDVLPYWIAQLVGGILAAIVVGYFKGAGAAQAIDPDFGPALVAEFLGTFALVYVVLNVATAKATAGNSYFGLAIGSTVMVMAFALGGISGGAFNPAVAFGLTVMGISAPENIWIYLLADLAGGVGAAMIFKQTVGFED
ncbi:MAG: MIP family channel protein [Candidatus Methylacidiphilales bacterium]